MATQDDIRRLDERINKERSEFNKDIQSIRTDCTIKHTEISNKLTAILVKMGQIEERQKQAYGELGKGDTLFTRYEERIRAIENRLSTWKGWSVGISMGASMVMTLLILGIRLLVEKLIKSL